MRRILLALAVAALMAVMAVGTAAADSSVVGPGESIQKAINAADPGDTIVVTGVHREDVVIRKDGIMLRGEDAVIEAPPGQSRLALLQGFRTGGYLRLRRREYQ